MGLNPTEEKTIPRPRTLIQTLLNALERKPDFQLKISLAT